MTDFILSLIGISIAVIIILIINKYINLSIDKFERDEQEKLINEIMQRIEKLKRIEK